MGFRICRIFGIDIMIDWSLFLIFGLIAWSFVGDFAKQSPQLLSWVHWFFAVLTAAIFISSILFHEMAHSLVARRFGIMVRGITLFFFGGVAQLDINKGFRHAKSEFLIAIAGPLSSVFLAGIFYVLAILVGFSSHFLGPLFFLVFTWLCYINIILAVFNMIPLFPMDGGRVFRSILWWKMKNLLKATKIAVNVSVVLTILLPIAAYFFWGGLFNAVLLAFVCFFFLLPAARAEYGAAQENNSRI